MRSLSTRRGGSLLLPLATLWSCSAGEHYHTDAATFLQKANEPSGSLNYSEFLGATDQRAYLCAWSGLPWWLGGGEHVYSVELDALPEALAREVRAGRNPWAQ